MLIQQKKCIASNILYSGYVITYEKSIGYLHRL